MTVNDKAIAVLKKRHPEWREHHLRWRWMLDSLEGGERYRQAIYGFDHRGLPVRNLIRHKREYPDPRETAVGFNGQVNFPSTGTDLFTSNDPAASASDDDYELRRSRTPVPTFVAEAIDTHLSRIYSREVKRSGPTDLMQWWSDVDGSGCPIDQWMSETIAPLLLVLGQLDIYMDHPVCPDGEIINTRADLQRLGLHRCIASYILPENMLWWKLDLNSSQYVECLVREIIETDEGPEIRYRYWTKTDSTLMSESGEIVGRDSHGYGRVPIVRIFDRRKPRCGNIGQSRYESVAERQREYYNRDSELILSDTTQAHPLLQGPEDFVQADGTIPIGPGWLLPKKKNTQGGSATYEGFSVVDFPKSGADSIRRNKADIREDVDRDSALVRPTSPGGSVQSGLSKAIDLSDGNYRLAKIAKTLGRAERIAAELAWTVLHDAPISDVEKAAIDIVYPAEFDLYTAGDLAEVTADFQSLVAKAGALPMTESLLLNRLMRLCLPGLSDIQYTKCDEEIRIRLLHTSKAIENDEALIKNTASA